MSRSFVTSAPDIAEVILEKAASLPEGIESFTRNLLTKEASVEREKLELPKRTSLAELQKKAFSPMEKKASLPNIGKVSTEDSGSVVNGLQKIAKHYEEEAAKDVFTTAAAIVAQKNNPFHKKASRHGVAIAEEAAQLARDITPYGVIAYLGSKAIGKSSKGQKKAASEVKLGAGTALLGVK